MSLNEIIHHLAVFVSRLWQIHIFGEGNTHTTAVFFIKYLRTLGFEATNDIFAENAWYFRNALVRANYNNLIKGVYETTEYLELFLENLLCNKNHELLNREMHIRSICKSRLQTTVLEAKPDISVLPLYESNLIDFSVTTLEHIQKMYHAFGKDKIFGRSDMQSVTGLGASRASELLKILLEKKVIESVIGHGKGKYQFL